MKLTFEDVYAADGTPHALALAILYSHLEERTPNQSISHKEMPPWENHCAFVMARPYMGWWLVYDSIEVDGEWEHTCIGSVYFTRMREIGITISDAYKRRGYGEAVVTKLIETVPRGPIFANVSPKNQASQALFEKLGFGVVQWTYRLDPVFFDEPLYQGHPATSAALNKRPNEDEPPQDGAAPDPVEDGYPV